MEFTKAFSLCTIKVCRFEIIDGVKYYYCIKHAYKFLLSRVCSRSLTLASMCFLTVGIEGEEMSVVRVEMSVVRVVKILGIFIELLTDCIVSINIIQDLKKIY